MRFLSSFSLAVVVLCGATVTFAHALNWTKLTFEETPSHGLVAKLEIDLARYVGGYEAYHALAGDPAKEPVLRVAMNEAMGEIVVARGGQRLGWELAEFIPPLDEQEFFSALPAPMAFARFRARGSNAAGNLQASLDPRARMELPVVTRSSAGGGIHFLQSASAPALIALHSHSSRDAATNTVPPTNSEPLSVVGTFLLQGFRHILPLGVDHILFVLGLYFAGARLRDLGLQLSAFTLAHTCTLAAATLGWVAVPNRIVEPLIAASIIWIAWENFRAIESSRGRVALVFAFGLFHGLGFAGALSELALPAGQLPWALVGFNVGVELGQLAVLGSAFLLVGWWRQAPRYRPVLVQPASLAMVVVAGWWAITRITG